MKSPMWTRLWRDFVYFNLCNLPNMHHSCTFCLSALWRGIGSIVTPVTQDAFRQALVWRSCRRPCEKTLRRSCWTPSSLVRRSVANIVSGVVVWALVGFSLVPLRKRSWKILCEALYEALVGFCLCDDLSRLLREDFAEILVKSSKMRLKILCWKILWKLVALVGCIGILKEPLQGPLWWVSRNPYATILKSSCHEDFLPHRACTPQHCLCSLAGYAVQSDRPIMCF